jgi:hypothetical protein
VKGNLRINGEKIKDVNIIHSGGTDNLVIYREEEKVEQIIEYYSIIHSKIHVNADRLEISGYLFTGEKKGSP